MHSFKLRLKQRRKKTHTAPPMDNSPRYYTNSRNPNFYPKWIAGDRTALRLPKAYHSIAWDICQAIDQEVIKEESVREWLHTQIKLHNQTEEDSATT